MLLELCSTWEPVMFRQTAPGLQLLDLVSNSVYLRIGFILWQFQNLCLLFWEGDLSSGRIGMWLCEKEATLTERLENIKKERQKAIVKNVGTKCVFLEACGKDTISVSLFVLFANMERGNTTPVCILCFFRPLL